MTQRTRFTYRQIAGLIGLLMNKPRTIRQFARDAKISESAAGRFLRVMHSTGCVYVERYARTPKGRWMKVWAWGRNLDARMPPASPGAERFRKYRERRMSLDGALSRTVSQ